MPDERPIPTEPPRTVLDYRSPATDRVPPIDLENPIHPVVLAATSAVFGLTMPNHAGGSTSAWLASFGLVVAACWFIAVRLRRDRRIAPAWRPLLLIVAIACVVLTAFASIGGGIQRRIEWWRAHDEFPWVFVIVTSCIAIYVVVRLVARLDSASRGIPAAFPKGS